MPQLVTVDASKLRTALPFAGLMGSALESVRAAHEGVRLRGVAGVPTGLPKLDRTLGGLQPGLHIIGAEPGAGKTALCLTIARNAATVSGLPVVYASFDETPERLALKVLASRAGLTFSDVSGGRVDPEQVRAAMVEHAPHLKALAFTAADSMLDPTELVAQLKDRMQDAGQPIGLLVIDYLQPWAAAMAARAGSEMRIATGALALELRAIAIATKCPVLVVSAQSRSGQDTAKMTSLRESSDLEYGADSVSLLTKDGDGGLGPKYDRKLTFAKNRFGPVGADVLLSLDGRTQIMTER